MSVEERIECVKKFLLRTFLAAEKLNVVNAEQVSLAVTLAEFDQVVVLNCVDKFVDEKLARKINHLHVFLFREHILPDRLHQVRFAKTDAAVNKNRVVSARRCLRDCQTGGVGNFDVWSDHERFECIARIETEGTAA